LPVSDEFTNVSLASSQDQPPRLPELMSPEERRQITYDGLQTRRTLAALEMVARRSTHVNQQPYVELRDLLNTMSSDGAETSQAIWLYTLSILSVTLSLLVLTSRYWRRPVTLFIRRVFPYAHDQRPITTQTKNRQANLESQLRVQRIMIVLAVSQVPMRTGKPRRHLPRCHCRGSQGCYQDQGPPPNPKPLNECTSLSPENFSSGNDRDTGKTRNNGQNLYEREQVI
jgi:hypothetical protein